MPLVVFTAIDLYVALVVLRATTAHLPPEKRSRASNVEKIILASLVVCGFAFLMVMWPR